MVTSGITVNVNVNVVRDGRASTALGRKQQAQLVVSSFSDLQRLEMFYLSKLGNLLDEIDGGSGEKEGDATEPKEGGQGQGTLANSLGGLLTSASLAAGSVASSSTSVAKAQFGAITSLLGEDEDEPEEQVPDKAQSSRATEPPIPDADGHRTDQDVAASAVPARAQLPDEVPEASPAPSATSELVAGWSFEDLQGVLRKLHMPGPAFAMQIRFRSDAMG
eukprot:s2660_g1.t3